MGCCEANVVLSAQVPKVVVVHINLRGKVSLYTETRLLVQTFWHSSAHVLGEALEACFGVRLTIGPAIEEGFYYDCYMGDRTLTDAERPILEKKLEQVLSLTCLGSLSKFHDFCV
jgi:threonyl-tRNA synthetase